MMFSITLMVVLFIRRKKKIYRETIFMFCMTFFMADSCKIFDGGQTEMTLIFAPANSWPLTFISCGETSPPSPPSPGSPPSPPSPSPHVLRLHLSMKISPIRAAVSLSLYFSRHRRYRRRHLRCRRSHSF